MQFLQKMKENSPYLINSINEISKIVSKDDLFFDRQNERAFNAPNIAINEEELISQMFSTDPDDLEKSEYICHQIKIFYSKNSILNYSDLNEIRNFFNQILHEESPSYIKYGMKCFIAIFCQDTYEFDKDYALSSLVIIKEHLFNIDDQTIVQYALHIAARISGTSIELARRAYKAIGVKYLDQIIKDEDINIDIKEKALHILGHYCVSQRPIPEELIEFVCELASELFQLPEIGKLHQLVIYCCKWIAKKAKNFSDFFQKYSLFQSLNEILVQSRSVQTQYFILRIFLYFYRNYTDYDIIDTDTIFELMNHPNSTIQSAAISCISEIVRSNAEVVDSLIKMDIFEKMNDILENGSHKAKLKCIELLLLLFQTGPDEMTQMFIERDYVTKMMNIIQDSSENNRDDYKSLENLFEILIEMNRILRNSGNGEAFDDLIRNSGGCDHLFDLVENNNDISNLVEVFLSETDL